MADAELALFRAFPALEGQVPRQPFLTGPTPVEPLALPEAQGADLWVKRDDRSCPLYGGNKPRKLEFLIGAALQHGARRLVTTGALGTNHGLATTILGRAAGLPTTLVLMRQPVTPEVRENLLLCAGFGAELVCRRGVALVALATGRVLATAWLRGERPWRIPTGGSSALGVVGFVSAGLELAQQVREGHLPEPALIFLPVGTGGSMAGLVAGLRLAGLRSAVRGVLVTDVLPPSPRRLLRQARAALALLRRAWPDLPPVPLTTRDFALLRGQLGPGYGVASPEAREAQAAAARAGLHLETTYTSKCLAGLLAQARRGALPRGPVVFWNTYSSVVLPAESRAQSGALPRSLRGFW